MATRSGAVTRRAPLALAHLAGGALVVGGSVWASLAPGSPRGVLAAMTVASAGYLAGVWALGRTPTLSRGGMGFVLIVALFARAPLVVAPPVLEDDVYRYLWDGAVTNAGESPYRFSPQEVMDRRLGRPAAPGTPGGDAARLDHLAARSRDPALEPAFLRINYPSVPTVYPPAAQGLFAAVAWISPGVRGMKVALVALDLFIVLIVVALLGAMGHPRGWVLIYAWSPLALLSFAGSAHMDVLPMALLALAVVLALRGRGTAAGVFLGLAVAAKIFPLVAWPALRRKLGLRGTLAALAVALACYAPMLGEPRAWEGLRTYAGVWRFGAAGFAAFASVLPGGAARVASGLIVLAVALWAARKVDTGDEVLRALVIALAALVLFSPAMNPWYVAWMVPFLAVVRSPALVALAVTVLAHYANFLPGGAPRLAPLIQLGVPAVVAAAAAVSARGRTGGRARAAARPAGRAAGTG